MGVQACQPTPSLERIPRSTADVTQWVNPFIGTTNEGNTHPGAALPWGLAAATPHTINFRNRATNPAVYRYGDPYIYGFGSVNLSGLGCPIAGAVPLKFSRGEFQWDITHFESTYSKEEATPGYYNVQLDKHQLQVAMTATQRSTRFKVIPQEGTAPLNLMLDIGANMSHKKGGGVNLVNEQLVTGFQHDGSFCGVKKNAKIYFAMKVHTKPTSVQMLENKQQSSKRSVEGAQAGVLWVFDPVDQPVEVSVGISFVSTENALQNLQTEQGVKDFDTLKEEAQQTWNEALSKVEIEGGSEDERTVFYTALYHSLFLPHVISDVNGAYKNNETDSVYMAEGYTRYSTYSLWDTYRSLHPLLSLLYPKQECDMVQSMIEMYKEGGWLPKWELFGYDTYVMVGDPAVPVITDTYLKGITDFDAETALEAMLKGASVREHNPIRPGNQHYLDLGYIPIDDRGGDPQQFTFTNGIVWGPVSTTLEYNFADYNIAQLAKALGKEDLYQKYYKQSMSFTKLYDSETSFFRPKRKDGSWMQPFDPLDRHFDIRWKMSGGKGFVEGNAWQYNFFVPHAIDSLRALMGEKVFYEKLQRLFDEGQFDLTNEPDITYPYLFNYIKGKEQLTQRYIQEETAEHYTNSPDGIPGNDDAGTLSAWLVFAQLGIFPDAPGIPIYQLTTPKFQKTVLHLDEYVYGGKQVVLEKTGRQGSYFSHALLKDGTKVDRFRVGHQQLLNSGGITYQMDSVEVQQASM
ncbi:GH92 family glycosyl hydrolase [Algivirga pacifica]|uniref:GH92 family glycosyl hydrolase n=2 Tax=Algivirga pacifica TaxID=1162670 RepID=A0ABP9DGT3_9BACT